MPTTPATAAPGGRATDRSERLGRPAAVGLLPLGPDGPVATSIQAHPKSPTRAAIPFDR